MGQVRWVLLVVSAAVVGSSHAQVQVYTVGTSGTVAARKQLISENTRDHVSVRPELLTFTEDYYKALDRILQEAKASRSHFVCHIALPAFERDAREEDLVRELCKTGVLVVACVANDANARKRWPATFPGLVLVAASNGNQNAAARGYGYVSFYDNGKLTSALDQVDKAERGALRFSIADSSVFASARIAGILAYVWERNSGWSATQVISYLQAKRNPQLQVDRRTIIAQLSPDDSENTDPQHKTLVILGIVFVGVLLLCGFIADKLSSPDL